MNRTVTTILMILSILVFAVIPVAAQTTNTFTPQGQSTAWHQNNNWSEGHWIWGHSTFSFGLGDILLFRRLREREKREQRRRESLLWKNGSGKKEETASG